MPAQAVVEGESSAENIQDLKAKAQNSLETAMALRNKAQDALVTAVENGTLADMPASADVVDSEALEKARDKARHCLEKGLDDGSFALNAAREKARHCLELGLTDGRLDQGLLEADGVSATTPEAQQAETEESATKP